MSFFSLPRRFKRRFSIRRSDPKDKNATLSRGASMRQASAPTESTYMEMPQPDFSQASAASNSQTLKRTSTLAPGMSVVETNFWNVGGYKNVVNRLEDGFELGEKLSDMLSQRAKIEEAYANSLIKWKKDCEEKLRKKPIEYESAGNTWNSLLVTGEDTAHVHFEFCEKIVKSPVFKLNQWLKEKYQTQLFNFKLKKEFEKKFEKSQESWKKNIELLKKSKKDYYDACKKVITADKNERNIRLSPKASENDKKKALDDLNSKIHQRDNARNEYLKKLEGLDKLKGTYMESMTTVYDEAKLFEEARIAKFKEILEEYNAQMKEHFEDYRYAGIVERNAQEISKVNPSQDLEDWSKQHGPAMEPNWPIFEEYRE